MMLRWFVWLALAWLLAGGSGCTERSVTPEARRASRLAYDSLLAGVPDSVLAARPALDSLFLSYPTPARRPLPSDTAAARQWVDSTLAALSLDEKIGQLFIVNLDDRGLRRFVGGAREAVETYHVGGFLMPRLLAPREVFAETQRLQGYARVPLFFAADYERGVGRFDNAFTELPSNMAVGATRDTLFAAAAGRLTALESRAVGINLLFAPVVDVNNNPDNPIINIRSYGEDPMLVGRMAAAYVREAQEQGVLTTLKHFPGHGDTSVDTHARMGTVEGDSAALARTELRPYEVVLGRTPGPAAVMSAHLWIPALEPDPLPATFSRAILHDLLRERLGFDGIVVTDDVKMGALQNTYSPEERVVRPLLAGADVILTPANLERAVAAVREAVAAGRLTEADLDRSVRRVLAAKARAGLHRDPFADEAVLEALLERPRGAYIAQTIADRAVTLLRTAPVLPLRADTQRVALVQMTNYQGAESIEAAMDHLAAALAPEGGGAEEPFVLDARLDENPTHAVEDRTVRAARRADVVVLALYLRLQSGRGNAGLFRRQAALARRLLELETPVVLVTFGNPYAAATFRDAEGILVTYDQTLESVDAAAGVLRGTQPPRGRLPITVDPFPFGSGLDRLTPEVRPD